MESAKTRIEAAFGHSFRAQSTKEKFNSTRSKVDTLVEQGE